LRNFDGDDFLHIAPCDEFFVYLVRRPNNQIDRIWATQVTDIKDIDRVRCKSQLSASQCIGVFLLFTYHRLRWIIKDHGVSWNGDYFRNTVIPTTIDFLMEKENVISSQDVIILHDKAPGWAANATFKLWKKKIFVEFGQNPT
jgi:hypothetical protein